MTNSKLIREVIKECIYEIFVSEKRHKKRKLKKLLLKAKKNSPLYNELYKDINVKGITPDTLSQLPTTNKIFINENYDKWSCDQNITKQDIINYTKEYSNSSKAYLDKYVVDSTSGTTGEKFVIPNEQKEFEHMLTMGALHTWPKKSYIVDLMKSWEPVVYIIPTDGFYASLLVANTYLGLSKSNASKMIDIRLPIDRIVAELNSIKPILIGGYVCSLIMLADEAEKGNLKINPKYMVTIGSVYNSSERKRIESVFGSKTFTSYSCTEGGEIGVECINGHYHIARDVIIESVDDKLMPVKDGEEGKSILITNLWNMTSPFIRYKVSDRCIIHSEACGCGRKSKWIEVFGRERVLIPFKTRKDEDSYLTDISLEKIIYDLDDDRAIHQLIIDKNNIEVRIYSSDEALRLKNFKTIKNQIINMAEGNNIYLSIQLSTANPIYEDSGKLKHILIKKD